MKTPNLTAIKQRSIAQHVEKHRKVPTKNLKMDFDHANTNIRQTSTGIAQYTGPWEHGSVFHLLKRTLFGATSVAVESFQSMGLEQTIVDLISEDPIPRIPVNDYHYPEEGIVDPDVAPGETWTLAPYNNEYEGYRILSLKSWLINNIVTQPNTIHEKMILFWHNLLVTQTWDVFAAKASYKYFMTLRSHALGNFKDMVKAITLDPSMLLYLNGTFNNKEAPDENYARELQELFCIGKGPDAKYTEKDVQSAAKVLTGWVISWESFEEIGEPVSFFYDPYHDTSNKAFSSFYDDQIIDGRSGPAGEEELDDLLDMIFSNKETALYVCRRLYQFFVYSEIDAAVEQDVIVPLAEIFRANNYEIDPVLKALFSSEHFFDEVNQGAMIKNPLDFLLGTWKSLDIKRLGENESLPRLLNHQSMLWTMADQGLELGDPPSVSGWPAYYQAPQYDKYWITTDTITSRAITTDSLWYWGFWVNQDLRVNADLIAIISTLDEQNDPNLMLQEIADLVLGIKADQSTINALKRVLLNGQDSDIYWTSAWQQLQANPEDQELKSVVENRLKATFQQIFQLGECQLM